MGDPSRALQWTLKKKENLDEQKIISRMILIVKIIYIIVGIALLFIFD